LYSGAQAVAMAWDIRNGSMSEPEIALIPHAVQAGDTVIDIGANYGMYTYYLSRAVGPGGVVHAFEPVRFTAGVLRRVIRFLGIRNARLHTKGCGDSAQQVEFFIPTQPSGALSAGQSHFANRADDRAGREQHVKNPGGFIEVCEIVRLDDALAGATNVSLIKSDAEGADFFALRGAASIIERDHPTIICEINPWFLEGFGVSLDEILRFLETRDYEVYRLTGTNENARLVRVRHDQITEDNYVFIHPSRAPRLAAFLRD
jgi:FkbM family methyltransferase